MHSLNSVVFNLCLLPGPVVFSGIWTMSFWLHGPCSISLPFTNFEVAEVVLLIAGIRHIAQAKFKPLELAAGIGLDEYSGLIISCILGGLEHFEDV